MVLILVIKPPAFLPLSVNLLDVSRAASDASSNTSDILLKPIFSRDLVRPLVIAPVSPMAFVIFFSCAKRSLDNLRARLF